MTEKGKDSLFSQIKVGFQKVRAILEKIPLNPPLQKGEVVGMPRLIEMLPGVLATD